MSNVPITQDEINAMALEYRAHQYGFKFGDGAIRRGRDFTQREREVLDHILQHAVETPIREIINKQDIAEINNALTELRNIANIAQIRHVRKEPAYLALEKARNHLVRINSMLTDDVEDQLDKREVAISKLILEDGITRLRALYDATNKMMAHLGADGEIDTDHPAVDAVMHALHKIDGGNVLPPDNVQQEKRT